jgi:molybdopterin molybdotransferase
LPLNRNIASTLGRTDILRLKFVETNNNNSKKSAVEPLKITGSGVLSSMAKADCYTIIGENIEGYEKGEVIKVYILH